MEDEAVLSFLQRTAARARYVTAVCTGSLLLGAAGLLEGYRATTHWAYHELLAKCGATPVRERVVVDRNRVTGGGVTSGIDFALRLAAELGGDELSRSIQLMVEYDPEPPYHSGTPVNAEARLVERARAQLEPFRAKREAILDARLRRA
jgi:cyclohexyl-isocyanide hydratase